MSVALPVACELPTALKQCVHPTAIVNSAHNCMIITLDLVIRIQYKDLMREIAM